MIRYTTVYLLLLACSAFGQNDDDALTDQTETAEHEHEGGCTPTEMLEERVVDLDAKIDRVLDVRSNQIDALIDALNRQADDEAAAEAAEEEDDWSGPRLPEEEGVGPLLPPEDRPALISTPLLDPDTEDSAAPSVEVENDLGVIEAVDLDADPV